MKTIANDHEGHHEAPVWGAKAIGQVIGCDQRKTFYLLENGMLPAKKVGGQWVADPRRLREAIL